MYTCVHFARFEPMVLILDGNSLHVAHAEMGGGGGERLNKNSNFGPPRTFND